MLFVIIPSKNQYICSAVIFATDLDQNKISKEYIIVCPKKT